MAKIIAYLTFNGNCRQAMTFYQRCLGGELYLQTVGDSPLAEELPPGMRDFILHSSLRRENLILMATDMVGDEGLVKGNTISVFIQCNSETEIRKYYKLLSEGGTATHPLESTFWGALFGELTDRYGNHWMLNFSGGDEESDQGGHYDKAFENN